MENKVNLLLSEIIKRARCFFSLESVRETIKFALMKIFKKLLLCEERFSREKYDLKNFY